MELGTNSSTLAAKLAEVDQLASEIFATTYGLCYDQAWLQALGQMDELWDYAAAWDAWRANLAVEARGSTWSGDKVAA